MSPLMTTRLYHTSALDSESSMDENIFIGHLRGPINGRSALQWVCTLYPVPSQVIATKVEHPVVLRKPTSYTDHR